MKYRRRSIGLVKKISLLSILSSDDDEDDEEDKSPFSERISLIKNDLVVVGVVDDDIVRTTNNS